MRFQTIFAFLVFSMMLNFSCKKESSAICSDDFDFVLELQEQLNELELAIDAYVQEPSVENCLVLQRAYENYLDAAEGLSDCAEAVGQGTEYKTAIQRARTDFEDLEC